MGGRGRKSDVCVQHTHYDHEQTETDSTCEPRATGSEGAKLEFVSYRIQRIHPGRILLVVVTWRITVDLQYLVQCILPYYEYTHLNL